MAHLGLVDVSSVLCSGVGEQIHRGLCCRGSGSVPNAASVTPQRRLSHEVQTLSWNFSFLMSPGASPQIASSQRLECHLALGSGRSSLAVIPQVSLAPATKGQGCCPQCPSLLNSSRYLHQARLSATTFHDCLLAKRHSRL